MNARTKARALTTAQPTATLITSLRLIAEPKTAEERMVRAWIIDELEERYPAAGEAVAEAFEKAEERMIMAGDAADLADYDVDYVAVLLAAIPHAA